MQQLTGADLRAFREFLKLSQEKFAPELGCSVKMLYMYETNKTPMSKPLQLAIHFLMQKFGYEKP